MGFVSVLDFMTPQREMTFYPRSVAWIRLDFTSAPQTSGAFLHVLQTVAVSVNRRGIESHSIIFHHQTDGSVVQLERETDRVSVSVPKTVARGFSSNGK